MAFPDYTPTTPVFVRELAARFGDKELIVLGERRLTYAAAERESAELARGLLAAGLGKGSHVGLLMPNGPDWVLCWLAATRIGAVMVPINTFYQARELGWILRHADVEMLLCVDRFLRHDYPAQVLATAPGLVRAKAPLRSAALPHLREVRVWGEVPDWCEDGPRGLRALTDATPEIDEAFLQAVESEVRPADPMLIVYSSGSTAAPKGAIHGHGTVIRHSYNLNQFRDLLPDDRVYTPMPFFWVGGFAFGLVSAMHIGAAMVCEDFFEPGKTLALLERERISVFAGWPHYAKSLAEHPDLASRDLSSMRAGTFYAVLPQAARPTDPELRSNALGMTETCGPHTIDRMDVDLPEERRGSFGRAVPGLEHKIVDVDTGEPLPPGEVGDICIRGYSLMQGLYKVERADTFDADGFYHSGDLGRFDAAGYLYFQGRTGDMIKTGGANVAPREVEVALEALPEVKEAYVVGVADPERGQTVATAVILQAGCEIAPEALHDRLKSELSAYKVPRHFFLCAHDELPFTDTGKIDKRKLETLVAGWIGDGS